MLRRRNALLRHNARPKINYPGRSNYTGKLRKGVYDFTANGSLRMGHGFDNNKFGFLCSALRLSAERWRELDSIPKSAANILVDLCPAMDASSFLYPDEQGNQIRQKTDIIGDLIGDCVKSS